MPSVSTQMISSDFLVEQCFGPVNSIKFWTYSGSLFSTTSTYPSLSLSLGLESVSLVGFVGLLVRRRGLGGACKRLLGLGLSLSTLYSSYESDNNTALLFPRPNVLLEYEMLSSYVGSESGLSIGS